MDIFKHKTGLNKTILINLFSTVILQGIAFITVPIFTRVLGSEQFGYYSIFNTWVSLISIIFPFGLSTCITSGRYYFKNEYFDFRNNLIIYNILMSLFLCVICIFFYKPLSFVFNYSSNIYILLFLTGFSQIIVSLITSILIFEKRAILNFIISILLSVSTVLLSLYLIFTFNFKNLYEGRVYGHFIPYFLMSIFLACYMLFTKKIHLDIKYFTYGVSVGLPIVFHLIAHNILSQSDKIMMEKLNIPMSEIGIYGAFVSFSMVVNLILNAFNTSFSPFYADYIDSDDKDALISKSKNYIEVFTIICCGFILLSREVSYIVVNSEYYSGINLLPLLVLSAYFIFMYQFAVNYEFYYRKSKTIAFGTICAAASNIILNLFLLKKFGMYGAAFSTLISYVLLFIFHYLIVLNMKEKRYYVTFNYFLPWLVLIIFTSLIFYVFKHQFLLRWSIGIIFGVFEIYRILCRKRIF